ncbi:MAG: hypothetical protein ACYC18_04640, partial [Gammaproteobacteria bacterium]
PPGCRHDVSQQHPTTLSQPSSLLFNILHLCGSRAVAYPSAIQLVCQISQKIEEAPETEHA